MKRVDAVGDCARALGFRGEPRVRREDMLASAQMLRTLIDAWEREDGPDDPWAGPGHSHEKPGVWDMSNEIALVTEDTGGRKCDWCALWKRARRLAKRRRL